MPDLHGQEREALVRIRAWANPADDKAHSHASWRHIMKLIYDEAKAALAAREEPLPGIMGEQEAQEKVIGKVSQRDRDVWEAGRIYERAAREDTERSWDHSRPCDCGHRYGQHSQEYGITCDAENCGCRQLHQRPDPPCTCGTKVDVDDCEVHPFGPVATLRRGVAVDTQGEDTEQEHA